MKDLIATSLLALLFLMTSGCNSTAPPDTPTPTVSATTPVPDLMMNLPAPVPKAVDQEGKSVDLAAAYKAGPVLLFFYPKAGTPGCTAQACALRDSYDVLSEAGLTIYGVSTDSAEAQKAFQTEKKLPFTLLADPEGEILKAFGVAQLGGLANREAFLIKDGVVVWHDASASTSKQADDVIKVMAEW